MKKHIILLLTMSVGLVKSSGIDLFGVRCPWTSESPGRVDTFKMDKVRLMRFLADVAGNTEEYKSAVPVFLTLGSLISENTEIGAGNFMYHTAVFSPSAERTSKSLSKHAYGLMKEYGVLADGEIWEATFTYNCNRLWPPSIKHAIQLSLDWINN